jgi:outer membrane protein OmpA-like peptidoglycan-associated protein
LKEFRVGAGFGPGLSRGLGTPEYRGLLSLDWVQSVEKAPEQTTPSDRDGDGIYDEDDACPGKKGVATDDPKTHGCPPPPDADGDGIIDDEDACPDEPGPASDDKNKNGCPLPKDADKDGILDVEDACVNEPGIKTDDPKTNGCPPPKDTDEDTVMDPEDACPTVKGKPNKDPKKNGCPEARVEKGRIVIIERVEFEYNSAKLQKDSERVLQAVLDILKERTDVTKISIEGHTDDRGNADYNKGLSGRRAQTVEQWFVARGVAKNRLKSAGFGKERPIDSNDTEEGRQNNRRVEFHIVEVDGKPVAKE